MARNHFSHFEELKFKNVLCAVCFLIALMGGNASLRPAYGQAIITVPPSSTAPAATSPPVSASTEAGDAKITTTSTQRKGKTASEIFLGVYLSLDKDCKIGPSPKLEISSPPQNGKVHTRNFPINLRDVPGAPRRTCIGTSPSGMAVIYRSERKFKGEENILFRLIYPNKDIREVTAKIIVE